MRKNLSLQHEMGKLWVRYVHINEGFFCVSAGKMTSFSASPHPESFPFHQNTKTKEESLGKILLIFRESSDYRTHRHDASLRNES